MCGGEESPEWGHLFGAAYSYRRALRTTCAPYEAGPTLQTQQATKGHFCFPREVEQNLTIRFQNEGELNISPWLRRQHVFCRGVITLTSDMSLAGVITW